MGPKNLVIFVGTSLLLSSAALAYNADQHTENIKTRCASLRDSSEQTGCFNNNITVLEQIRRRERAEQRQKAAFTQAKQRLQSSSSSSSSSGFDNSVDDSEAEPQLVQTPAPVAKPQPVVPAPEKPAQVAGETPPAPISAADAAKAAAERKARYQGFLNQITDRQSTNVIDETAKSQQGTVASEPAPAALSPKAAPTLQGRPPAKVEKPAQVSGEAAPMILNSVPFPEGMCPPDAKGNPICQQSSAELMFGHPLNKNSDNVTETPKQPLVKKEEKPAIVTGEGAPEKEALGKSDKEQVADKTETPKSTETVDSGAKVKVGAKEFLDGLSCESMSLKSFQCYSRNLINRAGGSQSLCYQYVKRADNIGGHSESYKGPVCGYFRAFGKPDQGAAINAQNIMSSEGFVNLTSVDGMKAFLKANGVTDIDDSLLKQLSSNVSSRKANSSRPIGSVNIYRKSGGGAGHIEVKANKNWFASDFKSAAPIDSKNPRRTLVGSWIKKDLFLKMYKRAQGGISKDEISECSAKVAGSDKSSDSPNKGSRSKKRKGRS